jgi:mRNA interferase MazF
LTPRPKHGRLFVADLNPRRGTETGKVRPVLVIQTDLLNDVGHPCTWILPCTTKLVAESLLRVLLPKGIAGNTADCEVMIDQGRAIDNDRIKRHLGVVPKAILVEVKDKVRRLGDL